MSKDGVLFTWQGYDVTLSGNHQFYVTDLEQSYPTAEEAKTAIDSKIKAEARIKKKKIDLAVIGDDGERRSITGIHATQDKFLYRGPEFRTYGALDHKPDVAWLAEAETARQQLLRQAGEIEAVLEEFNLASPGRGWSFGPYRGKDLSECYDILEADYADKKSRAEATTLGKELERKRAEVGAKAEARKDRASR